MISRRELEQLRAEWTLDIAVIEKDYLLGWLLAGIAAHPALGRTWVFKGGTCLRKCYYETFRFSEDLDFTVMPGGPDDPDDLRQAFGQIAEWLIGLPVRAWPGSPATSAGLTGPAGVNPAA